MLCYDYQRPDNTRAKTAGKDVGQISCTTLSTYNHMCGDRK